MRALFEVGEAAVYKDDTNVVVLAYREDDGCTGCRNFPTIRYSLTIPPNADTDPSLNDCPYCQCTLSKKQEPGESFDSVMQGLKKPIDEPVFIENVFTGK